MIAVEVYRNAGDHIGEDVQEALLGDSLPAALARGRAELDAQAHPKVLVTLELPYRADLGLGDLLAVSDPDQGPDWRGQVVGVTHSHEIEPPASITTLSVERLL